MLQVWQVQVLCFAGVGGAGAVCCWCGRCRSRVLQVWQVQVPCAAQYRNSVQLLLEQLDSVKRLISRLVNQTRLVTSSEGESLGRKVNYVSNALSNFNNYQC